MGIFSSIYPGIKQKGGKTPGIITAVALLLTLCLTVSAQVTQPTTGIKRCATMESLNKMINENPLLLKQWQAEGERKYQNYLTNKPLLKIAGNGEIIIPVVVHIVVANPNNITDRDVADQIDRLNIDFAGLNVDTNVLAPEFRTLLGKTKIRFALARTDTLNNFTSGIERKASSLRISSASPNTIKHASSGGLNAWDVTKYFNIWVGNFSDGVLGVSTFPFQTPASEQGVIIHYLAFGNNPCKVYDVYNMGRTLVHETGHFFYLYHIWGDDDGSCSGTDFKIQAGYPLTATCNDDTPNQGNASSGYLGGYITDNCATVSPGINYANYMDYTNDVCYSMFTKSQVCRMENALEVYRNSLKSSEAMIPPDNINDAYLVSIQPGGSACAVTPVVCPGTAFKAVLQNTGSNILTTVQFNIQFDNNAITTINWNGNLSNSEYDTVLLGTVPTVSGNHTVIVYTDKPNGGTDDYNRNDTLMKRFRVAPTQANFPFTEGFEQSNFTDNGWFISNPDGGNTWQRSTTVSHSGNSCIMKSNYTDAAEGQWDDLVSPPINIGNESNIALTFWLAYQGGTNATDGLEVWVSSDCGGKYIPVYRKSAPDLMTTANRSANMFTPTASQWRQEKLDLSPYIQPGQPLIIVFRSITGSANNLYIDDIQLTNDVYSNDAGILTINNLPEFQCNVNTIQPAISVINSGINNLSGFTLNYSIDNGSVNSTSWTGNLALNQSTIINLNPLTVSAGQHIFKAYTSMPNGVVDGNTINDTLVKQFTLSPIVSSPLKESFENNLLPPAGWGLSNSVQNSNWARSSKANVVSSSADAFAMYANGANTTANNPNEIRTPVIQTNNADSVFLKFDIASAQNNLSILADTMQVLLTTDCGNTFQIVYNKNGRDLQTASYSNTGTYFPATDRDYKTDSINLTSYIASSATFQLLFRYVSNGNDIYIDNINVYTKSLPERLKKDGYLIYPNPSTSYTIVQHQTQPKNLEAIVIYNAAGQRVYVKSYSGNANSYIIINTSAWPSGVYFVQLLYTDKNKVSEKLLKIN